jgi:hypothetical protein
VRYQAGKGVYVGVVPRRGYHVRQRGAWMPGRVGLLGGATGEKEAKAATAGERKGGWPSRGL